MDELSAVFCAMIEIYPMEEVRSIVDLIVGTPNGPMIVDKEVLAIANKFADKIHSIKINGGIPHEVQE